MITERKKAPVFELKENNERIVEALLFIINEAKQRSIEVDQYRLVKALFLADRAHLNKYGRPITFDNYAAMRDGPVASRAYNILIKDEAFHRRIGIGQVPWSRREIVTPTSKYWVFENPERQADEDVLSPSDMQHLSNALSVIQTLSYGQIRKLTHEDQAYIDAWEDDVERKSFPMSLGMLFDLPNFEEAKRVQEISNLI